jgi:hypothetical protein
MNSLRPGFPETVLVSLDLNISGRVSLKFDSGRQGPRVFIYVNAYIEQPSIGPLTPSTQIFLIVIKYYTYFRNVRYDTLNYSF